MSCFLDNAWFDNGLIIERIGDVQLAVGFYDGRPWLIQKVGDGPWCSLRNAWPDEVKRYDEQFLLVMQIRPEGEDAAT